MTVVLPEDDKVEQNCVSFGHLSNRRYTMKQHWNITIEGLVQGVFFRATAREKAGELGLTGYIENRRNGSVFIEAEGTEGNLNKFFEWCHSGPPRANVSKVSYELSEVRDLKDFTIRR